MAGGDQIDMNDQENQHHEGADGMERGNRFEIERHAGRPQFAVIQIGETGNPDQRVDQHFHPEIGQCLHRIVLARARGLERVRFALKDAPDVVANDEIDVLETRNVLAPLTGGEVPEDGEQPERDQGPRCRYVQLPGLFVSEHLVAAVDLEPGQQHDEDQQELGPVPEAFEAGENIDAFHDGSLVISACGA